MKVWHGFAEAGIDFAPALPARRWSRWLFSRTAAVAGALGGIAAILVLVVAGSTGYALGSLALLVLLGFTRTSVMAVAPADSVVLVGRTPMAAVISSLLTDRDDKPHPRPGRIAPSRPTVLRTISMAEAATTVRAARCDEVIVAGGVDVRRLDLLDARGIRPTITSGIDAIERLLGRVPLELLTEDRWLTRLGQVRSLDRAYAAAKRALDITLAATVGLMALPILPLVALAVRLDSPGPALFGQLRMGHGGRPFRIYKFRTMREAPAGSGSDWTQVVWTQAGDPRVTRIGRFLRVSRLDELPQLWNVLRGDMTFVGPRPEWVKSTERLEQELPDYPKRYAVKPGLTGWAQVCYRYTNSIEGTRRKLEYDLYYVKHASLRLDLVILLRTILVVLRMRGQ